MGMKTPYSERDLKTDEHLLKISRGSSSSDYSWELYSNNASFDRGALITGTHFCGGHTASFDSCVKAAESFGFGISI